MDREIIFAKVCSKTRNLYLNMQFALHFQHNGSFHASEIGWALQNIQDYICHKSERVF